jgi:hypothetical protein
MLDEDVVKLHNQIAKKDTQIYGRRRENGDPTRPIRLSSKLLLALASTVVLGFVSNIPQANRT